MWMCSPTTGYAPARMRAVWVTHAFLIDHTVVVVVAMDKTAAVVSLTIILGYCAIVCNNYNSRFVVVVVIVVPVDVSAQSNGFFHGYDIFSVYIKLSL
jgi:hypothetical protein